LFLIVDGEDKETIIGSYAVLSEDGGTGIASNVVYEKADNNVDDVESHDNQTDHNETNNDNDSASGYNDIILSKSVITNLVTTVALVAVIVVF